MRLCILIVLSLFSWVFHNPSAYSESSQQVLLNAKKSGAAKPEKHHDKKTHKIKSVSDPEVKSEADFVPEPATFRNYSRQTFSAFAATPELARIEYRYSLSPFLALSLGASGPVPVKVDVSMPSDVIKAEPQKGLAVAYPAFKMNFKVDWGPHVFAGAVWHPFGGSWYSSLAAGARSVRIKGNAASPLRVCSIIEAAKEPPCGNDTAAIQTRNSINIDADIKLLSYAARAATGWIFNFGPKWVVMTEAGLFAPIKTISRASVRADIISPDGTPEDLSGTLADLRSKSEDDMEGKALSELSKVINRPIPVLGIGVGYRF